MTSNVFNMDCTEGMKLWPDKWFDLAIVDPPYGINAPKMNMGHHPNRKDAKGGISTANRLQRLNNGGGKLKNRILNRTLIDWDNATPTAEYFEELFRVSKNQIIWGGNYFNLPPTRCFIVWDKIQPWENFSQAEFAWTSFDNPAKVFKHSNRGGANEITKIHPTEKPIKLYDFCFKHFAKEGYKILDTHLGSGNSRISADKANLSFVGYETNKTYLESSIKNYNNYKQQLKLNLV